MPVIRATFFFKDSNNAGWSETFYNTAANLTLALDLAKLLLPNRVSLLGSGSKLVSLRVSDDLIKRDSQIYPVPIGDQSPLRGNVSEHASNDLVVRLEGGTPPFRTRRTLALRGIPTLITGNAGVFRGDPGWDLSFFAYAANLKRDGWAIKYRDKTVPIFALSSAVQDVVTSIVTVGTSVAHGYAAGDLVLISGVSGAVELNGLWVILATPTALTFTLAMSALMRPFILSGRCNKNNYALSVINNVLIIRSNTHKAGRPFDTLVGRRRGRARR